MTHLPWMPVFVGDELAEASGLNAEEYGAYALLKMHLWQHGRLPADDERLARIAKCAADRWLYVREMIWNLFEDDWRHPRLEALRTQSEETHKKRSEAGRKGGRPRASEKPGNNPGFKPGFKPGFSSEKAGPKHPQPQPHPYSDPPSESEPQVPALDREGRQGSPKGLVEPFPIPPSEVAGRSLLLKRGVPIDDMSRCLAMLMAGHLTPYDIEEWDTQGAAA